MSDDTGQGMCVYMYFVCVGLYIATNQIQLNQAEESHTESVKSYEAEFEKSARNDARKKKRREVSCF